ncbi:MAG: hypothetical protein MZW92_02420 [Comamonadaceae bacterium]|nr:hypothetical protein [Comamonadaceae bacterium]
MRGTLASLTRRSPSFATRHPWPVLAVTAARDGPLRLRRDAPRDRHRPHRPSARRTPK